MRECPPERLPRLIERAPRWAGDDHRGECARPVVGGVFIKMLADEAMWKKWSVRGQKVSGEWAAMPVPGDR